MAPKTYDGKNISVTFDMSRCIHARNCFLKLPDVFDPDRRPWLQPDNAPAEEISAMIRTCPSGALSYTKPPDLSEAAPRINRITVLENGPLSVAGDLEAGERRQTLCRCGLSKNKPYCDASHVKGQFAATGEPLPKVPVETSDTGGHLKTFRVPDGPLKVDGNVEITTGTGRRIAKLDKAFLCRCGASKNKPFCDGSHKDVGFSDDD